MKLRLVVALASVVLLLAPTAAVALDSQQGRALMLHNANESAQSNTDISLGETGQDTAYGGVAGGQSEAGSRQDRQCSAGVHCKVYFGQ